MFWIGMLMACLAQGQAEGLAPAAKPPMVETEAGVHGAESDTGRELPDVRTGEVVRAAPFELTDLDGERVGLESIRARVVVLHFWSKYRDCDSDLEVLQRLRDRFSGEDVAIVGLVYSSGTREEVRAYLDGLGVSIPTLMCSNGVRLAYDVATFPTTFLLDGEHHQRYWMYGILVEEHWEKLIAEMLAGN